MNRIEGQRAGARLVAIAAIAAVVSTTLSTVCSAQTGAVPVGGTAERVTENVTEKEKVPAVSRPLWEFGLGIGGLALPDYRGSDERSIYALPVPYIAYRGKWLRADKDGARAVFIDAKDVEVNLSVNGSPPTRNTSRGARQGMPKLPGTFEIGPNLNYTVWRSATPGTKLDLRLPVRAAITLQRSPESIGLITLPHVNLDQADFAGGWNLGLQAGPIFATRRYHQHFYGVDAAYATSTRPAYRARGGYSGWQALAATSRRFGSTWVGGFIRYDHLAGAAFEDSPLVKRRSSVTAGFGISWLFAQSDEMVDVPLGR